MHEPVPGHERDAAAAPADSDPAAPWRGHVPALVESILEHSRTHHLGAQPLPSRHTVVEALDVLCALLFPGFFGRRDLKADDLDRHVADLLERLHDRLHEQIRRALAYASLTEHHDPRERRLPTADPDASRREADRLFSEFVGRLPRIRRRLSLDVLAAYESDPAARHTDEIIFCYPGMYALSTHRLAHELHELGVPLIPRIMAEHAHTRTGIDIHPGARIGESLFVDHGTGVVIGETTVIGRHCKIYQGVTLGAKSFPRDERGDVVRGKKRHPTLGDHVTVYAGATILGGDTVIGEGCVVNGGVFLTQSVPPRHVVRQKQPELRLRSQPGRDAEGA